VEVGFCKVSVDPIADVAVHISSDFGLASKHTDWFERESLLGWKVSCLQVP
jgi:hypothetical protein